MRLSAGSSSPERRSALALAAVALAALTLSFLLTFVSTLPLRPRASAAAPPASAGRFGARPTAAAAPPVPTALPAVPSTGSAPPKATLWTLLTPWALAVDALALLGIAGIFGLRRAAARARGARR